MSGRHRHDPPSSGSNSGRSGSGSNRSQPYPAHRSTSRSDNSRSATQTPLPQTRTEEPRTEAFTVDCQQCMDNATRDNNRMPCALCIVSFTNERISGTGAQHRAQAAALYLNVVAGNLSAYRYLAGREYLINQLESYEQDNLATIQRQRARDPRWEETRPPVLTNRLFEYRQMLDLQRQLDDQKKIKEVDRKIATMRVHPPPTDFEPEIKIRVQTPTQGLPTVGELTPTIRDVFVGDSNRPMTGASITMMMNMPDGTQQPVTFTPATQEQLMAIPHRATPVVTQARPTVSQQIPQSGIPGNRAQQQRRPSKNLAGHDLRHRIGPVDLRDRIEAQRAVIHEAGKEPTRAPPGKRTGSGETGIGLTVDLTNKSKRNVIPPEQRPEAQQAEPPAEVQSELAAQQEQMDVDVADQMAQLPQVEVPTREDPRYDRARQQGIEVVMPHPTERTNHIMNVMNYEERNRPQIWRMVENLRQFLVRSGYQTLFEQHQWRSDFNMNAHTAPNVEHPYTRSNALPSMTDPVLLNIPLYSPDGTRASQLGAREYSHDELESVAQFVITDAHPAFVITAARAALDLTQHLPEGEVDTAQDGVTAFLRFVFAARLGNYYCHYTLYGLYQNEMIPAAVETLVAQLGTPMRSVILAVWMRDLLYTHERYATKYAFREDHVDPSDDATRFISWYREKKTLPSGFNSSPYEPWMSDDIAPGARPFALRLRKQAAKESRKSRAERPGQETDETDEMSQRSGPATCKPRDPNIRPHNRPGPDDDEEEDYFGGDKPVEVPLS
ncbi:uncharacterized protein LOC129596996 [Paramacrobiotus metropolitanus]|uniref:uncharacterized protein LOC129596996 n=1 Tax=Paramacrobiotus metropolitanus TaxID=2943436 RepID=UPI002445EA99|nr:uncharacterized protein LOC129596996 [Paramacrobiotus metropolitanus]